ncbi:MAG: hypothetical protein AB7I30_22765, partial [Isosphaeraceae bacterium]
HGMGHATTVMASSQQVMPAPQGPIVTGDPCGDPGCGLGHNVGCGNGCGLLDKFKSLCGGCGGAGCGMCGGLGHLGKVHGLLGSALGVLGGGHHIKWFNGPGGPVPLTPGYVNYVNPVRSPRDFFAFPPMSEGTSGTLPVQASYVPPATTNFTPPAPGPAPGMEPRQDTPPPPSPAQGENPAPEPFQ